MDLASWLNKLTTMGRFIGIFDHVIENIDRIRTYSRII